MHEFESPWKFLFLHLVFSFSLPRPEKANDSAEGIARIAGAIALLLSTSLSPNLCKHILYLSDNGKHNQEMFDDYGRAIFFLSHISPIIGIGNLKFPKAIFAEIILSEVFTFSSSVWMKTLQEVYFLIRPGDDTNQVRLHISSGHSSK